MAKQWTEEERRAFGEKMRAAHAAKKAQKESLKAAEAPATMEEPEKTIVTGQEDTNAILARALEAIETLAKLQAGSAVSQQSGPQVANGRVVGIVERYSLDPANYPSPVERLSNEPKLARFAFPMNYELEYSVSSTQYETKAGITQTEPKFELELRRIILDDNGEPTNKRYKISGLVMFEDPASALEVARSNGINVNDYEERAFLNEMRYIQMRDWLFEQFFKVPDITQKKNNRREMVIDGKIVEYFEINSEGSSSIPFSQLGDSKL